MGQVSVVLRTVSDYTFFNKPQTHTIMIKKLLVHVHPSLKFQNITTAPIANGNTIPASRSLPALCLLLTTLILASCGGSSSSSGVEGATADQETRRPMVLVHKAHPITIQVLVTTRVLIPTIPITTRSPLPTIRNNPTHLTMPE